MTEETSGREKVLEEALRRIDDIANGRDSLDAYPRSAAERLQRLAEIAGVTGAALASPSTPEPASRGGKVEEIATTIEACAPNFIDEAATRITNRLAPEFGLTVDGMTDVHGICQEEIASALRTYAGESAAQSELERAAITDIQVERERQMSSEGWSTEHDDNHDLDELASAAACYALPERHRKMVVRNDDGGSPPREVPELWPWAIRWWNPKDRRRDLIRAGALIVADIERLKRAALSAARKAGAGE